MKRKLLIYICMALIVMGASVYWFVNHNTASKETTKQTQTKFYIAPPEKAGTNNDLRKKLGVFNRYDGVKKEYFDQQLEAMTKKEKSVEQVKQEIYQLELWEDANKKIPEDVRCGVDTVYTAIYETKSNDYSEIDKLIKKDFNGKYADVNIYWDDKNKINRIGVLAIQFMYQ
ncbi:hypothetical protein [Bacillus thuringiensis]|uniref:hypothetical protein n=1 Tax=Bacillus thuringiensis TaxID=1428 RepID=UPI001298E920|nr:hypothetical protein [Bacillus thuringiensis]MEB8930787.1 hypothetical protein [Bacillus cereus]MCR6790386.1 hypothetical protein [Bacillus thuringiensis]MCR6826298.1 hypothetical protein [Bacillus thuringiensis]MCR6832264.1 hypothetical protein [Bacillus thuringiensis]MEB9328116.1 hypothetical protein [Bacillus cereus]